MKKVLVPLKLVPLMMVALGLGCLLKETTHTLYIERDGSVSWTVLEEQVRSDAQDSREREQEESGFLSRAQGSEAPVAAGLRKLGAEEVHSHVLRKESPFTVFTEGRFGSVEALARAILDQFRLPGRVELETKNEVHRLVITLYVDQLHADPADEPGDQDEALASLVEDLKNYRIVLIQGRFLEAKGFAIVDDGAAAVPVELPREEAEGENGVLTLFLTWTTAAR